MNHILNVEIAKKLGINHSILITNVFNQYHYKLDDISIKDIVECCIYFSEITIRRMLLDLQHYGLIEREIVKKEFGRSYKYKITDLAQNIIRSRG